jgi:hypothetical protein
MSVSRPFLGNANIVVEGSNPSVVCIYVIVFLRYAVMVNALRRFDLAPNKLFGFSEKDFGNL